MGRVKQQRKMSGPAERGCGERDLGPYEGMKIVVLDCGTVELAYPHDWSLEPDPQGYLRLEDAEERCLLDFSYLHLQPSPPDSSTLAERLREVLVRREHSVPRKFRFNHHEDPARLEIHELRRPDLELAWCDYTFDIPDRAQDGTLRLAHGRWLLGANEYVQTLWTFYYWDEDAAWAVHWWQRMLATLQLGRRQPAVGPDDHWLLRDPD